MEWFDDGKEIIRNSLFFDSSVPKVAILFTNEPYSDLYQYNRLIKLFSGKLNLEVALISFSYKSLDPPRTQPGTRVITQLNTSRSSDSHQQLPAPSAQGFYHSITLHCLFVWFLLDGTIHHSTKKSTFNGFTLM